MSFAWWNLWIETVYGIINILFGIILSCQQYNNHIDCSCFTLLCLTLKFFFVSNEVLEFKWKLWTFSGLKTPTQLCINPGNGVWNQDFLVTLFNCGFLECTWWHYILLEFGVFEDKNSPSMLILEQHIILSNWYQFVFDLNLGL